MRSLSAIVFSCLLSGCMGASGELKARNASLEHELDQSRASLRTARGRIADLRHELVRAKAEAKKVGDDSKDIPALPVEVLKPVDGDIHYDDNGQPYEVVGTDQDGNAIIYAGDALKAGARIEVDSSVTNGGGRRTKPSRKRTAKVWRPDHSKVPSAGDSIPMMTDTLPTISNQLRKAKVQPEPQKSPRRADPYAEYRNYYAALRSKRYEQAIAGFRQFLQSYRRHELADNAQYWLAESYYDQKQFSRAAAEFRRVIDVYPRGNKVADAMLKLSFCHISTGEVTDAKTMLARLQQKFPGSRAAELAASKLATL